jgi:hypothetical protein
LSICGQTPRKTLFLCFTEKKADFVFSEYNGHMNTNSTIRDVVNHPSFRGFGQFILPLDRGTYDENMQLSQVGYLLPYHSHVEPEAVANTINYMIDQTTEGKIVFYDFYTERQKRENLAKKNTGLFLFKGRPGPLLPSCVLGEAFPMSLLFMKVSLTRYS